MQVSKVAEAIKRIQVHGQLEENKLREMFLEMATPSSVVLDCGKSLRNFYDPVKNKVHTLHTLDLNRYEGYPDFLIDVCDSKAMRKFRGNYDFISCFSLLEHCYNPLSASENLFNSLKNSGWLIGSAPFLFPRHAPDDLSYQDFFRFTRDAYAVLFPEAITIELWPLRGRVATSLNVLSTRYRFFFEDKSTRLARHLNRLSSQGRQGLQSSGYGFVIKK